VSARDLGVYQRPGSATAAHIGRRGLLAELK